MGEITVSSGHLGRLLADSVGRRGHRSYQAVFAELADAHRGRPVTEILPLLIRAADEALLGFSAEDLREQAEAIHSGRRYALRVRVT
ncbi:hypothetical protein EES43_28685 [Streptomyces sp. ADI96-02]|uniref:hypothetical protein n=1 Tax=unclassified Streptomyces TaxID=2593676 RepID=UPI000F557430|nr:hypothetical protein [Streptomyces sp. ADI96-02]RPK54553.1 hypothetical protein EES43_28685 [Streptomyces sp. ADI96-02]